MPSRATLLNHHALDERISETHTEKNLMWQGANINTATTLPAIQTELKSGEKLLWNGRPQGGIKFRPSDIFLIPFSLMWGGFAVVWELGVILAHAPFFFVLWGIPFVLIGLYITVGRFFVDARTREKTSYAVTDQRIIIVSELFGRKIQSLTLRNLPELTLAEKPDGSGTVTFGAAHALNSWGNNSWPGAREAQLLCFEMIENVRHVYNTLLEAQQTM